VRFDPLLREGAVVPALVEALERSGARFEWCRDAVVLGSERPGHRTGPRSTLRRWIRAFERSERGAA
jgi:hypothetical protein